MWGCVTKRHIPLIAPVILKPSLLVNQMLKYDWMTFDLGSFGLPQKSNDSSLLIGKSDWADAI